MGLLFKIGNIIKIVTMLEFQIIRIFCKKMISELTSFSYSRSSRIFVSLENNTKTKDRLLLGIQMSISTFIKINENQRYISMFRGTKLSQTKQN